MPSKRSKQETAAAKLLQFRATADVHARLLDMSTRTGRPMTAILEEIIRRQLGMPPLYTPLAEAMRPGDADASAA